MVGRGREGRRKQSIVLFFPTPAANFVLSSVSGGPSNLSVAASLGSFCASPGCAKHNFGGPQPEKKKNGWDPFPVGISSGHHARLWPVQFGHSRGGILPKAAEVSKNDPGIPNAQLEWSMALNWATIQREDPR